MDAEILSALERRPPPPRPWPQAALAVPDPGPASNAKSAPAWPDAFADEPGEAGFEALRSAYRRLGGIGRHQAVPARDAAPEAQAAGPDSAALHTAAQQVHAGAAFGFEWQQALWIPMFQFESHGASVDAGARQVLAELGTHLDGWALAVWFVRANDWLEGRRPVDLLRQDLPSVLAAARTDRFIATG